MSELVETSPKLSFVCDTAADLYKEHPEKGQFIHMPLGQEAHAAVKKYLASRGVPEDAVEIINGSINNSPEKKEAVTARFNDPEDRCKIIIGGKNTAEGIDLNGNSFVMYNCSLGWNPTETVQAEGRIWRQGNMQGHVHCVYPVMNDSIDATLYQKHDEKRSRINDLWSYKGDLLNVEEINPEELKFEIIKDPKRKAELILAETTKDLKAELEKTKTRINSFDILLEARKDVRENLEENEDFLRRDIAEKQEAEAGGRKAPSWIDAQIRSERQNIQKYRHQLKVISDKLEKMGVRTEEDMHAHFRELCGKQTSLTKEIEEKKNALPRMIRELQAKREFEKAAAPSPEAQRLQLEKEITGNLRPMEDVAHEIKTERFERMLASKVETGEISEEERDVFSRAGYKAYEEYVRDGIGRQELLAEAEKNAGARTVAREKETALPEAEAAVKPAAAPAVKTVTAGGQLDLFGGEFDTPAPAERPAQSAREAAEKSVISGGKDRTLPAGHAVFAVASANRRRREVSNER